MKGKQEFNNLFSDYRLIKNNLNFIIKTPNYN